MKIHRINLWTKKILAACVFSLFIPLIVNADPYSPQNFDSWGTGGYGYTNTYTNLTDGWMCRTAKVVNTAGWYISSPNGLAMERTAIATTVKPAITTPLLTNGFGRITFATKSQGNAGVTNFYEVKYSPDLTNWTTIGWFTNAVTASWTTNTVSYNVYTSCYVQICKTNDNTLGTAPAPRLLIDDINLYLPLSRVSITNVATTPSFTAVDSNILIRCNIYPEFFASSIVASLCYSTNAGISYTTNNMTETPADSHYYVADDIIPAIPFAGSNVFYYIKAVFNGPTSNGIVNLSPTNAPTSTLKYQVRMRPYTSIYSNMYVSNAITTNMQLIADNYWEGVSTNITIVNPFFEFRSGTTNWGDSNQAGFTLPINGTAENSTNISVNESIANKRLLFRFNETNLQYIVQYCEHANFDAWSSIDTVFAVYTNSESWVLSKARTTSPTETSKAFLSGRSAILQGGTNGCLISPLMPNGIGALSFRYRNWLDTGLTNSIIRIQKSVDKTNWNNIAEINPVFTPDYIYYSLGLSDPLTRYARIVNCSVPGSNQYVCIDDATITLPGSVVTMSNLLINTFPANGSTINIQVDYAISGGASNLRPRVYWRSPDATNFDWLAMSTTGNVFYGNIPPTITGTNFFYIECEYDGVDAAISYFPVGGQSAPTNYFIPAYSQPYRIQNFETWTPVMNFDYSYTNSDGWMCDTSTVDSLDGYYASPTQSIFFNLTAVGDTFKPAVYSPLLTNGVGSIFFAVKTLGAAGITNFYNVQRSYDGTNWTTMASFTNANTTGWTTNTVSTNIYTNCYVRISKTSDNNKVISKLYIDDIIASPPSAEIEIYDVHTDPGYPRSQLPTRIYCAIRSKSEHVRAYDFKPFIYYSINPQPFTNFSMIRSGTNNIFYWDIPASQGAKVEYYIGCNFAGYYYTNGVISNRFSPTYASPAGLTLKAPSYPNFFTYVGIRFATDIGSMQVEVTNGPTVSMTLIDHYTWSAFLDAKTLNTNYLSFRLGGLDMYNGWSFTKATNYWGDNAQPYFDTPLYAYGTNSGSNIVINIDTGSLSQLMVKYNTSNNLYEVRRCQFQDFNNWITPDDSKFVHDVLVVGTIYTTNNLDDFPVTQLTYWPGPETFEGLPSTGYITGGPTWSGNYYYDQVSVISERLDNVAMQLHSNVNSGALWSHASALPESGVEYFSFKYRAYAEDNSYTVYTSPPINAYSNYMVEALLMPSNSSARFPTFGILAYVSSTSRYEFTYGISNAVNQTSFESSTFWKIYRYMNGAKYLTKTAPRVIDNSYTFDRNLFRLAFAISSVSNICMSIYLNDALQYKSTDLQTNCLPANTFGFISHDTDLNIMRVDLYKAHTLAFDNSWPAPGMYTTSSVAGWTLLNGKFENYKDNDYDGNYFSPYWDTTAGITTPNLGYSAGKIYLWMKKGDNVVADQAYCSVEGWNGSAWSVITNIHAVNDMTGYVITNNSSGTSIGNLNYTKIQFRNNSTTGNLRIASCTIREKTPSYSDTFGTAQATNWSSTNTPWYVATNRFFRTGYYGDPIGVDVQVSSSTGDVGYSTLCSFTATSQVYQYFVTNLYRWQTNFFKIKHTTGLGSLMVDDIKINSWTVPHSNRIFGAYKPNVEYPTNWIADPTNWVMSEWWVNSDASSNKWVELWRSKADPASNQYLRTCLITGGVGRVYYSMMVKDPSQPASLAIEYDTNPFGAFTNTNSVVTNIVYTNWVQKSATFNTNIDYYIRFRLTSTNNTVLYLDDFILSNYKERDERSWEAYNVNISSSNEIIEYEPALGLKAKTAYLNNDPLLQTDKEAGYYNSHPFIQSGKMSEGIGDVSFWYRNYKTDGNPPAILTIWTSPTDTTPTGSWNYFDTIYPINDTVYVQYSKKGYRKNDRFLRIYSSTSAPNSRVCIDNILIMEPLAANVTISNLVITPQIPMHTNSVKFTCDFSRFILNPSNIKARLYYHIGENDWGNTNGTWNTNTCSLDFDEIVLTNKAWYRMRTSGSIPVQGIDTVVQYHVSCSFTGLFSQYSSPQTNRDFVNPEWYYPVNLNSNKSVTNPYYYVFSCPPKTVWINEFNYPKYADDGTNEYVELCGPSNTIIANWRIENILPQEDGTPMEPPYESCIITNGSPLPDDTNGFGFFIWGDPGVENVDVKMTNVINDTNLCTAGGFRLVRSMGAWEQRLCYDSAAASMNMVDFGYEYTDSKSVFRRSSASLINEGSSYTNFSWYIYNSMDTSLNTPGRVNEGQNILINTIPYTITITGLKYTSSTTFVMFVATAVTNIQPVIWYTTNLTNTAWTDISPHTYDYDQPSGSYTQWFNTLSYTNVYYKVKGTN